MNKLLLLFALGVAAAQETKAPTIEMELQLRYRVLRGDILEAQGRISEAQSRLNTAQEALRVVGESIERSCGAAYTVSENQQTRKLECVAKPVK